MILTQSSSTLSLPFMLIDSSDHLTGKTGVTPTVTLSKNGAAFAAPSGAVTEVANGWYKVAGNATDTNTLGSLVLHATGTGADASDTVFEVQESIFSKTDAIETGVTMQQAIRYILAFCAGKSTGANTSTIAFKAPDGTTSRVTLTVDTATGERSAVALNG